MKTIMLGAFLALGLAAPALANHADCCEKKDGKMSACCEKAAKGEKMPCCEKHEDQKQDQQHEGHAGHGQH